MELVMVNSNVFSLACFGASRSFLDLIINVPQPLIFIIAYGAIIFWLVGKKLKQFAKPERPIMSPVVRFFGGLVNEIGFAAIIIFTLFALVLLVMFELGYIFSSEFQEVTFTLTLEKGVIALLNESKDICILLSLGALAGFLQSLLLIFRVIPMYLQGEGFPDVKNLVNKFNKLNSYDPLKYIKLKKGCFIGLTEDKKPIYLPWIKVRETHIQILGSTGSGKGVILSLIAYQSILAGESLCFLDPKFDRYSSRILESAAKKAGKNFHFINLNADQPAQINPLIGASANDIEELLVSGFDLKGKGTDGDFHRGRDEDAAILASRIAISENALSFPELLKICAEKESITEQENFWRKFLKLADLQPINTKYGLDLNQAIKDGDVIYIVGSTDNERVKMLQKMLIVRIHQIIKAQDRFSKHPNMCLIFDEFKYLLSPIALTGLGAIRDFDAHCLLAHQSMGDLSSCPNISREEAEGVVKDTTAIKIIFKIGDANYAQELSLGAGNRPIFVEQASKNVDEDGNSQGGWRETLVPVIPPDLFTHLPMPSDREKQAATGVLIGVGVATIFHTSPILVNTQMPKPIEAISFDNASSTDRLMDLI